MSVFWGDLLTAAAERSGRTREIAKAPPVAAVRLKWRAASGSAIPCYGYP